MVLAFQAVASQDVNIVLVNIASFLMLIVGLLSTFPPFMDLLQGR